MATMALPTILARLNSVVAAPPYEYRRALEPFSVDLQPNTNATEIYCLQVENEQHDGYFDFAAGELERIRINLARKCRRDAHGAYLQVVTDISSLAVSLVRDCEGQDYNVELRDWEVPEPGSDEAFVVGWIEFTVDYDRAL